MGPVLVIIASLAIACLAVGIAIVWQVIQLLSRRTAPPAPATRRARSQPPLPGRQADARGGFAMRDEQAPHRAQLWTDTSPAVAMPATLNPPLAHPSASAQPSSMPMRPTEMPLVSQSAVGPPSARESAPADLLAAGPWAHAFNENFTLRYDAGTDIVEVRLRACVMHTPADVEAAFRVASTKLRDLLNTLGREHAALVVDIAGLEVGADVTQPWGKAVRALLNDVCAQYAPGKFLIARYNSRASGGDDRLETVTRIQIITAAVAEGFQSNIAGSRDEAFAMVEGLRKLVALPER